MGLQPSADVQQIRHAYREQSRLYHPDTTELPLLTAKQKFQQLNEAYATLSTPERRSLYDLSLGYSQFAVVMPHAMNSPPNSISPPTSITEQYERSASAYLDANDRPLSPGELFALFIMLITFIGCLLLAIIVGWQQEKPSINPGFAAELGISTPTFSAKSQSSTEPQNNNHSTNNQFEEPVRLERSNSVAPQLSNNQGA
ncbi:J domain-containing protein [filamentous cyanobacterium LEGE 11480]|uniref:J domain-containing protein n=2 Tax=Romeriopsis TaxID=2992131 RepID=A0A928Z2X6_9CYAN|nr:J domain-containing protein [Romeriopsis navalis LEGE 11480]